eukprot:COSAG02_NODE_31827_length_526_cov_1.456674_1_plen_68_part_10
MRACVRACVRARVGARVRACVRVVSPNRRRCLADKGHALLGTASVQAQRLPSGPSAGSCQLGHAETLQ